MSEPMPETTPTRSNPFLKRLGPLPLWGWMGVGLALALAYYFWKQKTNAANQAAVDTTGSVDVSGQIPQFVNQTYVTAAPPQAPPMTPGLHTLPLPVTLGPPAPAPPTAPSPPTAKQPVITIPHALTRSWTSPSTSWTVADIGKGLKLANPGSALQPSNQIAKTFMTTVYPKNHNAKVPKGAAFTYVAGT